MSLLGETILNSLLCFLNSAKQDFSNDSILHILDAFYSHENIKVAKTTLVNLLHKDLIWRRDPEKKMKDLRDVIEYHEELKKSKMKVNFVCNTYKGMPPMGFEYIAPMISNLSEEIVKINDVLPKILDIKSQVVNTADTVRQLRSDVIDMKGSFNKAVSGIEEATNDITDKDIAVLNDIRSFRMSLGNSNSLVTEQQLLDDEVISLEMTYAQSLQTSPKTSDRRGKDGWRERNSETSVKDSLTGAIAKDKSLKSNKKKESYQKVNKDPDIVSNIHPIENETPANSEEVNGERGSSEGDGGWKVVGVRPRPRNRHAGSRPHSNYRVMGSRKDDHSLMKAVKRTADVFLGRVDKSVKADEIIQYIEDSFNVVAEKVEVLKIKSDQFNAFKITVPSIERDKLFNSELWPEGIVVNKYYNRRV